MVVLIFMGDILEKKLGKIRYLLIYFGGGIAGNCLSVYMDIKERNFRFQRVHPVQFCCDGCNPVAGNKNKGKLDDISGRKFVTLMIVLSVFQGYTSIGVDNSAHIGGLISGISVMYDSQHRGKTIRR